MRGATATAVITAALVTSALASPPATAAAYRYWTYWQAPQGTWAFATAGPATTIPADGAVEGWRFAVTSAAGSAAAQPQVAADFATLCADTPAQDGRKRVGLVIDFGTADAAPANETPPAPVTTCIVAEADATSYAMLRSVAAVRTNDVGLVCALADYPRTGCAELLDDTTADDTMADGTGAGDGTAAADATAAPIASDPAPETSSPAPTLIAIALIALIAGAAITVSRRRRA